MDHEEKGLNFATQSPNGGEDEWMFSDLSRFEYMCKNYRDALPDDNCEILWCRYNGEDIELLTFMDICEEFL